MVKAIIISKVQCPICKKFKTQNQLREVQNSSVDVEDDIVSGWALVSKCCNAIVAKGDYWDYNNGVFRENGTVERMKKLGWKIYGNLVIRKKPERS